MSALGYLTRICLVFYVRPCWKVCERMRRKSFIISLALGICWVGMSVLGMIAFAQGFRGSGWSYSARMFESGAFGLLFFPLFIIIILLDSAIPLLRQTIIAATTPIKYDAFLSHAWSKDDAGRDNHIRVCQLCQKLKSQHDLRVWLDDQQLSEDLTNEMSSGIDESAVFVACITNDFIKKVHGRGNMRLDDVR